MMSKNKSALSWTQQLFKKSSRPVNGQSAKIYYAHRYQVDQTERAQTPMYTLFAATDNQHAERESKKAHIQKLFNRESAFLENYSESAETDKTCQSHELSELINDIEQPDNTAINIHFTVLNYYDETPDTRTFHFGRHDRQVFDFLPGQYIKLTVLIDGKEYKRSYSLANSSAHSGILEITVKRDPNGGLVSNWLIDHLEMGDTVKLKGPFGRFSCADSVLPEKILFMAAGSGIVPIMSMLRWLTETEAQVEMKLLLSFRTFDDIIYREELDLMAARHKNIKLIITLTKELSANKKCSGLTGRIDQTRLAALVPDLTERTVYLCGPEAYMKDSKQSLQNMKLPMEQLFCESFTVNGPASTPQKNSDNQFSSGTDTSRIKTGNYWIEFAKSGKTVSADGAKTLLELAKLSGVRIDHECRAGNCGECMVKCLKGQAEMTEQAEIDDRDRKKGWVYSCCAYPLSNMTIDV